MHRTHTIFQCLAQTSNTSYMNILHGYKALLRKHNIQSPMLGQPLITTHFRPQTLTYPGWEHCNDWLTQRGAKAPVLPHPTCLSVSVRQTLNDADTFEGQIAYVDGSEKGGQAGSSFYFPRDGLRGKQRVAGPQTAGRGELNAILGALTFSNPTTPLNILCDCFGVVRRCNKLTTVETANARLTMCRWKNRDLWHTLKAVLRPNVQVSWIPGHKGIYGNDQADTLANQARQLPPRTCEWKPEKWRLYHEGSEVGTEILHLLFTHKTLRWEAVNVHLSFCNLGDRGNITRLQWIWGRTSWVGVAPYWEYKDTRLCAACKTDNHPPDLFSTAALCPRWNTLRAHLFHIWDSAAAVVTTWYTTTTPADKRNFIRSLVPTSLVNCLQLTLSPIQIKTIVNHRDTRWKKTINLMRSQYNPSFYSGPALATTQPDHSAADTQPT